MGWTSVSGAKVLLAISVGCLCGSLAMGQSDRGKMLGVRTAAVRIEVYSDFQCPGCKAFYDQVLPMLITEYVAHSKAYVVNRDYPLPIPTHAYSREAAIYATAAAWIGKYTEVSSALFRNQAQWSKDGSWWATIASVLTVEERKRVQALAREPSVLAELEQEIEAGHAAGVRQTPWIVVIGGPKPSAFPAPNIARYPLLRSLIDDLAR